MKTIFPDALTEGKVNFDTLRQLLRDTVNEGEDEGLVDGWQGLIWDMSEGTIQ